MSQQKQWKYELNKRGSAYVIHQMEHGNGVSVGTPVFTCYNYEEARKKLYELNGWKYKLKRIN